MLNEVKEMTARTKGNYVSKPRTNENINREGLQKGNKLRRTEFFQEVQQM